MYNKTNGDWFRVQHNGMSPLGIIVTRCLRPWATMIPRGDITLCCMPYIHIYIYVRTRVMVFMKGGDQLPRNIQFLYVDKISRLLKSSLIRVLYSATMACTIQEQSEGLQSLAGRISIGGPNFDPGRSLETIGHRPKFQIQKLFILISTTF